MQDYLLAIANREIAWISSFGNSNPSKDVFASETQNSTDAHISLYQKFSSLIAYLVPKNKELATSHLWHWDVHSGNIFVEDDRITSIIDWQETWTGPLFLQFRHPKLVDYDGEVLLRLPDHYESLDQGDEKARIRKQVEKSIVLYSYETDTRTINPLLNEILGMHYGRTIRETIQFASNTWDRDIIPFRQSLIQIERSVYSSYLKCGRILLTYIQFIGTGMDSALIFLVRYTLQKWSCEIIIESARVGTSELISGARYLDS